jgi:hypothetical protein
MTDSPSVLAVIDGSGVSRTLGMMLDGTSATQYPQHQPRVNSAPVSATNPMPVIDINGAAFQGVVPISPGIPVLPARSLGFICTTAGNVTLTLADNSSITLAIPASTSFQSLPFAVTNVVLAGAAGIFWNLK